MAANQFDKRLPPLILPGYSFQNVALLEVALTHRSVGRDNNERLEFLGDAILGFVITDKLYQLFPDEPEGKLTRLRANLVNRDTLARLARQLDIGPSVRLGQGERKSGGWRRDSILANTLESIIGAIYLDSGMSECRKFIHSLYHDLFKNLDSDAVVKDPKTILQELLQAKKLPLPVYQVIEEHGEAHRKTFTVLCEITGMTEQVRAMGKSKRAAEQAAATLVLKLLEDNGDRLHAEK